jgi:hypothetical protein
MKKIQGLFLLFFAVIQYSYCQETFPLNFSAGIDLYYAFDFNEPIDGDRQYVTQAARHNEFNLNWGFMKAAFDNNRIRANLALQTGTYPQFNYANEPDDLVRMIAEANAGVKITDKIWIDAGIMPGHIGYENTFSIENEMYTRSLLSENTPYYQTGIQVSIAASENFDIRALVLNGWQNIAETNNAKSVGLQLNYQSDDRLELNYSNYLGNESTVQNDKKIRFYNNFYIRYAMRDDWHIAAAVDYGTQEELGSSDQGHIFGFMGLTQYRPSDRFHIAARIEYFGDEKEILVSTGTPNGFKNTNVGMTFDYIPVPYLKCRLEARSYFSPDEIYNEGEVAETGTFVVVGSIAVNLNKSIFKDETPQAGE